MAIQADKPSVAFMGDDAVFPDGQRGSGAPLVELTLPQGRADHETSAPGGRRSHQPQLDWDSDDSSAQNASP